MNDMALVKESYGRFILCAIFKNFAYNRASYTSLVRIIKPAGTHGICKYRFLSLNDIADINQNNMIIWEAETDTKYYVVINQVLYRQIMKLRHGW